MQQDRVALRFGSSNRHDGHGDTILSDRQVESQNYVHRVVDAIRNGCVRLPELHSQHRVGSRHSIIGGWVAGT